MSRSSSMDDDDEEGEEDEDGEYDLMEYGDEFNDSEERRYAKEMYGAGSKGKSKRTKRAKSEKSSGSDDSGDGEEEKQPAVEALAKSFSRRANRGQKMNALVTRALEADDD